MKKQDKFIKPAELVIKYFGGIRPTARILGRAHSSVNKWRRSKKENGCDGYIPREVMHKILDLSERLDLGITAYDLIFGRKVK